MSKRNKIIYWIATAWLALGMLSYGNRAADANRGRGKDDDVAALPALCIDPAGYLENTGRDRYPDA